ncbi:hypothetical protein [Fischerella sp. PCC 9605]|uniref:hypothetical protein n=1 Tax=Fischerella sp. PCC 9605 TaxID=1173024 RepID=UPI0012DC5390|nr:hypothetical protein [Fischerella sp. PCC 9605]
MRSHDEYRLDVGTCKPTARSHSQKVQRAISSRVEHNLMVVTCDRTDSNSHLHTPHHRRLT